MYIIIVRKLFRARRKIWRQLAQCSALLLGLNHVDMAASLLPWLEEIKVRIT